LEGRKRGELAHIDASFAQNNREPN